MKETKKKYTNANNVIELIPADFAFKQLAKSTGGGFGGIITKKKDTPKKGRCPKPLA